MRNLIPILCLLLAFLAACGRNDAAEDACGEGCDDEGVTDTAGASSVRVYTPELGTAIIQGVVKWEGKIPARRSLDMSADKYCANCGADALSETVIVGDDRGLANVFIQVKYGLRGWKFRAPDTEALLDQIKCRYVPHMLGLQVGQNLRVRNSDPVLHNVHALHAGSTKDLFNLTQTRQGEEDVQTIRRAGMYVFRCEVHGWMSAYVGVCKHPFFAVTQESGAYRLANVPPGEYTIEAWHEKYGSQSGKVTVADGATVDLDFVFRK